MKGEEFRIGNYAYKKYLTNYEEDFSIGQITGHEIMLSEDHFQIFETRPIKLNEEWLLKLGFEDIEDKNEEVWYHGYKDFVLEPTFFCYGFADPIVFDLIRVKEDNPLIYVHQLQNLYFALCGEELTIKI